MDYKNLLSGAGAGVITKTITSPLDRIKILYQTDIINKNISLGNNIKNIYKSQGLLSFYRGNLTNIIKIVPNYSLKFTFNEFYKKKLWNKTNNLSILQLMSVGMLTGTSLITITHPLDVLKTRFAISDKNQSFYRYSRNVLINEGIGGFYKGFNVSIVSGSLFIGLQLASYDIYKSYLKNKIDNNILSNLISGAGCGLTAVLLTYPGDVIHKKMHINGKLDEKKLYNNTLDCIKKTISKHGIRNGLYSGLSIAIIKTIPSAGIQFASYDFCKKLLNKII